ncbi:MAG: dicarboxylate/amino acid:cation symporter [Flavobacteriales bacterium]|nr:dicarboxylate/amino acid:cation symporter [Flavobacteriia bacterium]NCP05729.1 dicarboxylate/amino acid:cation symporter [Flavobacteriales bacterium]PIV94539.1 MAG: dicarboxylate/amino acid:cation symporter [Flavobacteriaceae bacterium CG17_big_fil_post_rev_8_21_14_2_50_33_15]PIY10683.1 MAG: dicarboxylate/amino acid:cation symporter [Flavobacteriaceae bacterium CG_4_10_14_3_um_filter_33_47]PJB18147.1 MAG: dicarboxylate/amino acid:cation symporter [Flavobacteriaceae bacterium CG_4_9_14_3_um_f
MKKLALHWKILIGMTLGIIWALLSSSLGWSAFTINWIDPFGTIFINLLKLIAVPLVLFSIISGVANIGDPASLGRMGGKTLLIYLITTVMAISLGLLLVNVIKPGKLIDEQSRIDNRISYEIWASSQGYQIKDGINYLQDPAFFERAQEISKLSKVELKEASVSDKLEKATQRKETTPLQPLVDIVPDNFFYSLSNNGLMLQIIFFAIFFGVCLLFIPNEKSQPVLSLVDGINEVFLKMVDIVMQAAPFFVFALLAGVVSKMAGDDIGKVVEIFKGLSWYSLTVLIGLLLMIFVVYPSILKAFVKKISYKGFFKAMSPAQTLAFSTSSSAATLPVTMECVEQNLGINKKISSFVLPIGATVNMDGTSLYQAVAVIFLAQMHMIDLTFQQQIVIVLTTTLASIGSAAVPSAGLVMLIIVLDSVGLNPAWIAIIFPVDRILDMFRTVVNVTGDATVCTIIADGEHMLDYIDEKDPTETFDLDS